MLHVLFLLVFSLFLTVVHSAADELDVGIVTKVQGMDTHF